MSWLARSLADPGVHNSRHNRDVSYYNGKGRSINNDSLFSALKNRFDHRPLEDDEDEDQSRGGKEDLSQFRATVTRQLSGVANFLAPPTPSVPDNRPHHRTASECDPAESSDPSASAGDENICHDQIACENSDLLAVGEMAVGGSSRFSDDRVVAKDLQFDKSCDQLGSRVEEPNWIPQAVGLTYDVLAFAGNIAHHPETWLDFPIEEVDLDDFDMSEFQKKHAEAIECLTPRLRALRIELCPAHMTEGYFWRVYFVLLHSRLDKHVAEVLSTSQVVEARAKWMHELQKLIKEQLDRQCYHEKDAFLHDDMNPRSFPVPRSDNHTLRTFVPEPVSSITTSDYETEKHPIQSREMDFVDKLVIKEKSVTKRVEDKNMSATPSSKLLSHTSDDDNDWPDDDLLENGNGVMAIPLGIEEEVSFSDLEDDDCSLHIKYNTSSRD